MKAYKKKKEYAEGGVLKGLLNKGERKSKRLAKKNAKKKDKKSFKEIAGNAVGAIGMAAMAGQAIKDYKNFGK